jgi:hypothetical protein
MTTPHEDLGLGREFADSDLLLDSTQNVLDSLDAQARLDTDELESRADDDAETQEETQESQDGTGAKERRARQPALVTRAQAVHDAKDKVARKAKALDDKRAAQEKKPSAEAAQKVAKALTAVRALYRKGRRRST